MAWFKKKIYVICWVPRITATIHVYQDEDPFGKVEEITEGLEKLTDPYDMHISGTHGSIFITEYANKYLWKIKIVEKIVKRQRIEWKPRGMSLTPENKLLVVVWKDRAPTQFFLDIYDYDKGVMKEGKYLSPEVRMSPPEGVTRIDHAVQSSNGNFIVSFANTDGRYVLSEMSRYETEKDGPKLRILRAFDPPSELVDWFPYDLAIDKDGIILISDYAAEGGRRLFQLNPEMTRLSILLDKHQIRSARPSRICCLPEDERLLIGFGKSDLGEASVSVFQLNQK